MTTTILRKVGVALGIAAGAALLSLALGRAPFARAVSGRLASLIRSHPAQQVYSEWMQFEWDPDKDLQNQAKHDKQGTNVVLLEPDMAQVFRDSATVNEALRRYLAEHGTPPPIGEHAR